ncbi:chaplin family protein [Streptomyces sp. NPDC018045]|uniref:chaplin family protein n=1 Tax=Streptomyces sp. NPDC018045 TaxID=3365037 RepID=UPI00379BAD41
MAEQRISVTAQGEKETGGSVWGRRGRYLRRRVLCVVIAAGGAVLGAPGSAYAANVIAVGNAAFGNTCASPSANAQARSATTHGGGLLGGNALQAPLELQRQTCGNSGIICPW